jgi:hypothetical protein
LEIIGNISHRKGFFNEEMAIKPFLSLSLRLEDAMKKIVVARNLLVDAVREEFEKKYGKILLGPGKIKMPVGEGEPELIILIAKRHSIVIEVEVHHCAQGFVNDNPNRYLIFLVALTKDGPFKAFMLPVGSLVLNPDVWHAAVMVIGTSDSNTNVVLLNPASLKKEPHTLAEPIEIEIPSD